MLQVMEPGQRERLSELVEDLTTSGQTELNQDQMKEVKKICRLSNDCVDHVYHSVMSQLNQDHAQIRLSSFQIAAELFSRSHHFRTLLVDNFQEFLELTVESDVDQPLPPPKDVARKLKSLAIQTLQSWQSSYGVAYKKLALGYHFLKQVKKVDFQDIEARSVTERRRDEERRSHLQRIYGEKAESAAKDMEESYQEMEATLTQMEACMKLLSPEFELTGVTQQEEEPACCSKDLKDMEEERRKEKMEEKGGRVKKEHEEKTKGEEVAPGEEGSSEEEEEEEEDLFMRQNGLMSHSYSLDVNLSPGLHIKETEDNEAVVSTVIDLHRLITSKHLPSVQGWIQMFTKAGEQQLLTRALHLKTCLEAALHKHKELHIHYKTRVRKVMKASADDEDEDDDDDDDDDDDFDEVPEKEGYEPHIPEHLRAEYGLDPSPSMLTASPEPKMPPFKRPAPPPPLPSSSSSSSSSSRQLKRLMEEEQDPTCAAATLRLLKQTLPPHTQTSSSGTSPSSLASAGPGSSKAQELPSAPVVPFGLDLYYWGQEQPNAGKIVKCTSQHQFWVPSEVQEEVQNEELLAQSRSRFISFPGNFSPVTHRCGAPLGKGRLCPRQDRIKCPFHGPIIPRDQDGRPLLKEDQLREAQRRSQEEPDWRDVELMRDIEAATGQDLGSTRGRGQKGKGKGKKKKFPHLSDLKQNANTARSRLEKKVFNKSSMRRTAQVLDKADRRKHDKFSNQFNYALN